MSMLWLVPAGVLFVGGIVLFDALRRLADEADQLVNRLAAVRDVVPDVRQLQADAAVLRTLPRNR